LHVVSFRFEEIAHDLANVVVVVDHADRMAML
jgi:hypothetical protein